MDVRVVPSAALRDANAVELARVWIAERGLHCSLKCGLYADQGVVMETTAWGIVLADMAGHVADALSAEGMGPRAALYDAIIGSFNVEAAMPTAQRAGDTPAGVG
ncbi:MAG: DUF5076 domain-containing protein [Caulobacter vibrioides]|uniref:DUF5076 domain-containing protein n=1 Tax=Caulobacter vibrioides TaxID=155892 RepID=A0A258DDF9_CAUVI|nr:MAG: DUF5076 domain-containing protein [Caulobacter vibrioides]